MTVRTIQAAVLAAAALLLPACSDSGSYDPDQEGADLGTGKSVTCRLLSPDDDARFDNGKAEVTVDEAADLLVSATPTDLDPKTGTPETLVFVLSPTTFEGPLSGDLKITLTGTSNTQAWTVLPEGQATATVGVMEIVLDDDGNELGQIDLGVECTRS